MKLTDLERKIWSGFMEELSNHLACAGCNDYSLENSMEARTILREMIQSQYSNEDRTEALADLEHQIHNGRPELQTYDFIIFAHLSDKINKILDEAQNGT